ncbi:MAG: hypothetical protein ABSA39_14565 [Edaphobacter sp.]
MIFAYGDESMDEKKERVCTVAALIGTSDQWKVIQAGWIERTKGIPFHANNCDSDRGDYENSPHLENKALYRDLIIMLANSGICGFAATIDLVAQAKTFPLVNRATLTSRTYFQAFMEVVAQMAGFAEHADEIAEITFDSRIESEHNAAILYANMRELNPGWTSRVASKLIFDSSRINPRIQVADLFAREAMKTFDNEFGPVKRPIRKSWEALSSTGRFPVFGYGEQWFADLKVDIERGVPQEAFDGDGYLKWLGDRQDNMTAFIEYTKILFKNRTSS